MRAEIRHNPHLTGGLFVEVALLADTEMEEVLLSQLGLASVCGKLVLEAYPDDLDSEGEKPKTFALITMSDMDAHDSTPKRHNPQRRKGLTTVKDTVA